MKTKIYLIVFVLLFVVGQLLNAVPVKDLDKEMQKAILSYSPDIVEVPIISKSEYDGDISHIYYETEKYIIIIDEDGNIIILEK